MNSSVTLSGPRVSLRPWTDDDLAPFAAMNDDPEVMRHMSKHLTREESEAFVEKVGAHIAEHGFGLTWRGEFDHPRLPPEHRSHRHVLYAKDAA